MKCSLADCDAPWSWEVGSRKRRLCDLHALMWLQGERMLAAELEEWAGRWEDRRDDGDDAIAEVRAELECERRERGW